MMTIRKTGGASVVTIPKAILRSLNLENGSQLEYSVENGAIVLRPVAKDDPLTLEQLLDGVEDGEYYDDSGEFDIQPVGREWPQ